MAVTTTTMMMTWDAADAHLAAASPTNQGGEGVRGGEGEEEEEEVVVVEGQHRHVDGHSPPLHQSPELISSPRWREKINRRKMFPPIHNQSFILALHHTVDIERPDDGNVDSFGECMGEIRAKIGCGIVTPHPC
jgi:hypothetical protein